MITIPILQRRKLRLGEVKLPKITYQGGDGVRIRNPALSDSRIHTLNHSPNPSTNIYRMNA